MRACYTLIYISFLYTINMGWCQWKKNTDLEIFAIMKCYLVINHQWCTTPANEKTGENWSYESIKCLSPQALVWANYNFKGTWNEYISEVKNQWSKFSFSNSDSADHGMSNVNVKYLFLEWLITSLKVGVSCNLGGVWHSMSTHCVHTGFLEYTVKSLI